MVKRWPVGLRRRGPMYGSVRLLIGRGASVECLDMFGVIVLCGVAEGMQRWQGFRIRFWVLVGRCQGMVGIEEELRGD